MIRALLASLVCAIAAAPALAQSVQLNYEAVRSSRIVTAVRTTEGIMLDGRLDEPVWQRAEPATDFYQKFPDSGAPASERTEVRFAYDDDNLYIGVICFDSSPERMLIKDLREDFDFGQTDMVQVFIDSLHDRRSGFTFVVNPAGARRDTQVGANGNTNQDWDGVWDAKVSRTDRAWFAEYVIPFKTLRFSNSPSQEWGVNVTRRILHLNEENNWAPVPIRFNGTRADLAGTLRGLEHIRQGRNLKIKPFATAGSTDTRTGGPRRTAHDVDGGLDGKYSLTPSMTLQRIELQRDQSRPVLQPPDRVERGGDADSDRRRRADIRKGGSLRRRRAVNEDRASRRHAVERFSRRPRQAQRAADGVDRRDGHGSRVSGCGRLQSRVRTRCPFPVFRQARRRFVRAAQRQSGPIGQQPRSYVGTSVDYFNGGNGKLETRSQDLSLGVQFENGGSVNFGSSGRTIT